MMLFWKKDKPRKRDVFAITAGDYVGQLFNYIKQDGDDYVFLSIPDMKIQRVPKEKFELGKEQEIIEYVEKLPRNIFQVVKKQYEILAKKEH